MVLTILLGFSLGQDAVLKVGSISELRTALALARPGSTIAIAPGVYEGGMFASHIQGSEEKPIRIVGADPTDPPTFRGGGTGLHLSRASHIEIANIRIEGSRFNGVNIDDGGDVKTPSRGIVLRNLVVTDLPKGNHDGIKLSGVESFRIENCRIERWGGSGVDMVGCHNGKIVGSKFKDGGDNGVQAKGGSSYIRIEKCEFIDFGQRGVNLGGSTGFEFFRPFLADIPLGRRFEARDIQVRGCTFVRGIAPLAFVGADGAAAEFNTIYHPGRWAIRILQETRDASFVPSRNGVFAKNLVVFLAGQWGEGGVNVGSATDPGSFQFKENFWFCSDRPQSSRPWLPTPEAGGTYGVDPMIEVTKDGRIVIGKDSPAKDVGAHALPSLSGKDHSASKKNQR